MDTANKHFKGQSDLVLLSIDTSDIVSVIAFERGGDSSEEYPHIFGPINHDAVKDVIDFPASGDGTFALPVAFQK